MTINKVDKWAKRVEEQLNIKFSFITNQTPFIFDTLLVKMMLNSLGFKVELITDSNLKPYKNILCIASISKKEIINDKDIKGGKYGILKMKLMWKRFEIIHILKYLFIKNPGRVVKSFFQKI